MTPARRRRSLALPPQHLGEHRDVTGHYGIRLGAVVDVQGCWVPVCGDCLTRLDPCETPDLAVGTLRDHWTARHPGVAA